MKTKKETIFKNTVGRPTNEIKKKRKVFALVVCAFLLVLMGVMSFLVTSIGKDNTSKLKAVSTSNSSTKHLSWGVDFMNLTKLIDNANSSKKKEVIVAVIDSGFDIVAFEEKYKGRLASDFYDKNGKLRKYLPGVDGKDKVDKSGKKFELIYALKTNPSLPYAEEWTGHGTHVAGIVADSTPKNVKIYPINLSPPGDVIYSWYEGSSAMENALKVVLNKGNISVVNISQIDYSYSEEEQRLFNQLGSYDIVVVACSGNEAQTKANTISYPGAYDDVIAVGAVGKLLLPGNRYSLSRTYFSNYGKELDFVAPGDSITSLSAYKAFSYSHKTVEKRGTSQAAPHVAAAAAIIKTYNSSLSASEIINILKGNSIDLSFQGWDKYYGNGFVTLKHFNKETTTVIGDMNNDGKLTVNDAHLLRDYLDRKILFTNIELIKADYDSSGIVDDDDYCAILYSIDNKDYKWRCTNYNKTKVKTYSGKDIYKKITKKNCANKSGDCKFNNSSSGYWKNYGLNFTTNVSAFKSSAWIAVKIPDNLSNYDTITLNYYLGGYINSNVKVNFWVNKEEKEVSSGIITNEIKPNTTDFRGISFSDKMSVEIDLTKYKTRLNNKKNKDYLMAKVYGDGLAALKIRSMTLSKKATISSDSGSRKLKEKNTNDDAVVELDEGDFGIVDEMSTINITASNIIGDVNDDGIIDKNDAKIIKNVNSTDKMELLKADYDSNGKVDMYDYCAVNLLIEREDNTCKSYKYTKVVSYTGSEIIDRMKPKIASCTTKSDKKNVCSYNNRESKYWNNGFALDYFANIAAKYKGTETLVAFKIPDNLANYDLLRVSYYVGSDKKEMKVGVGFWVNSVAATGHSGIKVNNIKPMTSGSDGVMKYTGLRSFEQDLSKVKKYLNKKSNSDYLIVKVYHDDNKANTAAVKIKSISLIKK